MCVCVCVCDTSEREREFIGISTTEVVHVNCSLHGPCNQFGVIVYIKKICLVNRLMLETSCASNPVFFARNMKTQKSL